ncbi:hypothetical protein GQX73_g5765 [Xylaria multiplex]|uniref:Rhodopsin domain-containing protein n=1 Tax=Xylaria multiplex TaxID=323545 RepID=A0A7C8N429_9PEZI|nr:hypothetical protein GQX73_g5765 [Xylaria multiplex]
MASQYLAKEPIVSLETFQGLLWGGFALCVIAFGCRAHIRILCHRRFLIDDWLMLASLLVFLGNPILAQLSLSSVYTVATVQAGQLIPGPDFPYTVQKNLHALGVFFILCYIGIWLIKLGFLVFFYRLGSKITKFLVLWWIFLFVTVASLAVILGTGRFSCFFGSVEYITTVCASTGAERDKAIFKLSVALDVISDALILAFPLSILWGTKITLRKKYVLSAVFSLVLLTIAVTIVRTSAYGGADETVASVPWVWFWLSVEWVVSFITACVVSFRALFVQKERIAGHAKEREMAARHAPKGSGFRKRAKLLHENLVETLRTLEMEESSELSVLPMPDASASSPKPNRRPINGYDEHLLIVM